MDRKDFFSSGMKDLTRKAYRSAPGRWLDQNLLAVSNLLNPLWGKEHADAPDPDGGSQQIHEPRKNAGLPRPPGALTDPRAFKKACTSCGDCIVACPHGAIFQVPGAYGPVLDPNHIACHLCEDFPCIDSCAEGALLPLDDGALPGFGLATLDADACLNAHRKKGERYCRECQSECPIEGVINYHAHGLPKVDDTCTGCGLCVESCPTRALKVE